MSSYGCRIAVAMRHLLALPKIVGSALDRRTKRTRPRVDSIVCDFAGHDENCSVRHIISLLLLPFSFYYSVRNFVYCFAGSDCDNLNNVI